MGDRVECLLEVHKAYIEWLLVLACLVRQYSEIRDLVCCLPSLLESLLFVCNFCFSLHLASFQYDPKKYLACMWDKSNCSVIYTVFKITFVGKWDERGERPFFWPLVTHILCILSSTLSSCFKQFEKWLSLRIWWTYGQGSLPWQPILWHETATSWHTPPVLSVLAFYNRWEYRNADCFVNIDDDSSSL